jgi:hypothetical protein
MLELPAVTVAMTPFVVPSITVTLLLPRFAL